MTELPDPHWKLYPEVDYDHFEELETLDEKNEREFDEWEDRKLSELDMEDLR